MPPSILLVEDSDAEAELTMLAFVNAGVKIPIVRARDGVEALEYLLGEKAPALPSAILLDLRMPRLDGLEVLQAIGQHPRTRDVPVIVMTSSNDDEDRLTAYARGALSFVRKPLDYEAFVSATRTTGLHWSACISVFGTAEL